MQLTPKEISYLTALAREQSQSGCRGPAHAELRSKAYSQTPIAGPGSLRFSYELTPLIAVLLNSMSDLSEIDDFLRRGERADFVDWPWSSIDEFRARLEEARHETTKVKKPVLSSS